MGQLQAYGPREARLKHAMIDWARRQRLQAASEGREVEPIDYREAARFFSISEEQARTILLHGEDVDLAPTDG